MAEELPTLNPNEHAMLEDYTGRKLTNEEAQILRKQLTLRQATTSWIYDENMSESGVLIRWRDRRRDDYNAT